MLNQNEEDRTTIQKYDSEGQLLEHKSHVQSKIDKPILDLVQFGMYMIMFIITSVMVIMIGAGAITIIYGTIQSEEMR